MEGSELLEKRFAEFGEDVVLYCNITSQVASDKDQDLLAKAGGQGFPHFAVLNADGNLLAKIGMVPRTTDSFRALVTEAKGVVEELADLRAKAAGGDKSAAGTLLEKELELRHLTVGDAKKRITALGELDGETRERLEEMLTSMESEVILSAVSEDPATHAVAGRKFAAMLAGGRVPSGRTMRVNAWYFVSVHAEKTENVELFEKAVSFFEEQTGIRDAFKKSLREKLDALKKKAGKNGK